jgi:hypothetical protein
MSLPKLYKFPHETPGFKLPPHGSQELMWYLNWLKLEDNEPFVLKAVNNLPEADTEVLLNVMKDDPQPLEEKRKQAALMCTFNLLANRICEQCGDKSDITQLSICNSCALAWYCSKECQEKHWPTHKLRCCKKDGPLNKGYQAIAFCKLKD